ncbi:MAG: HEPN domain-containing protein [Candidatus Eremiobacterota bacterium]
MKDKTQRLIEKSRDAIEAAEILLQAKKNNFAAGRAYYAMFYLAEALLYEKGYEFHKHTGVQAAFGKYFAKTGELEAKYHRYLLEAFESRLEGDYGVDIFLDNNSVNELIQRAKDFLSATIDYLPA